MISCKPLIYVNITLLSLLSISIAQAQERSQNIELKVYSDNQQNCPNKVLVTEKPRPYQEGSFTTDGSVNLSAYASNILLQNKNSFSATWVGTLKPKYTKCLASAGITKVNGQKYSEQINHLRMHFVKGKVYFILDLAGGSDPNGYPLFVLKNSVQNGNPIWAWGGSD